jgi:hypothetical protein
LVQLREGFGIALLGLLQKLTFITAIHLYIATPI